MTAATPSASLLANLDAEDVERSRWRLEAALGTGLLTSHRIERLVAAAGACLEPGFRTPH